MPYHPTRRLVVMACLVAGAAAAQAQAPGWAPFVSVSPVYQGQAGLDGGGDYSAWNLIVRAGTFGDIGGGNRAGVTFNYDVTDYSFSNPAAFGGVAPWGVVQRYGVSAPLAFNMKNGWFVGVVPSVDWIRENGADAGESLTWGGIVSATRYFPDGNRIGFGLAAFDRLQETSVFPLLIVDWALSDRVRLVNPLPAGPSGPAGLELDYRFDGGWNAGFGAAWRTTRFRLSTSGPVAGGIGKERGLPVFLRATRNFSPTMSLNLYAGVIAAGELRVEDASGNVVRKVGFDTAPLFGATLTARF